MKNINLSLLIGLVAIVWCCNEKVKNEAPVTSNKIPSMIWTVDKEPVFVDSVIMAYEHYILVREYKTGKAVEIEWEQIDTTYHPDESKIYDIEDFFRTIDAIQASYEGEEI